MLPGGALDDDAREAVLRTAGFVDVEGHGFEEVRSLTFEDILGYLASTSVCSRGVLGASFDEWAMELRDALGITPNAVKLRLHRARMALRTLLSERLQGAPS